MPYVYSTLSNDNLYTGYGDASNDVPPVQYQVLVKGGAGVANDRIVTPLGVMTTLTDEQVAQIRTNSDFLLHEKNGYVSVQDKKINADKATAGMQRGDGGSPLTPNDFAIKGDTIKDGGMTVTTPVNGTEA